MENDYLAISRLEDDGTETQMVLVEQSELNRLRSELANTKERLAAESGQPDGVDGWWRDECAAPMEAVWFLSAFNLEDTPWTVSVYRSEPGAPWKWDIDWNPPQSHRTSRDGRTVATGEEPQAWLAMMAAKAAYAAMPRPAVDGPVCEDCWGWGYWCDHGGGPSHACEACDNGRDCQACSGTGKATTAEE